MTKKEEAVLGILRAVQLSKEAAELMQLTLDESKKLPPEQQAEMFREVIRRAERLGLGEFMRRAMGSN